MSSLVPYFLLHRRLLLNLDFLQSSYKFFWDFYDNVNKNTTKVCLIFVKTTNTCLDFFAIGNWLFSNWSWCWRWIVSYEHHRLIECYRKSSQILMRLEELTNFDAVGRAHKCWCNWKRSQIYLMKVLRRAGSSTSGLNRFDPSFQPPMASMVLRSLL